MNEFLGKEEQGGFRELETYKQWTGEIDAFIDDLNRQLKILRDGGARIAAFAASAKGNTLLNACRLNTDTIDYIVDDTPEKIGKFSPGTGIRIVNRSVLAAEPPDYLIILAWNFAREIIESTTDYKGKYIIPIPTFKVVESADGIQQ